MNEVSYYYWDYYFNELLGNICKRIPSISVRIVPFFVHFNVGSGHASARQFSISIEPVGGRNVELGNLIVNLGWAKYKQIKHKDMNWKW